MKTVVYDPLPCADNVNPASMPAVGKSFSIGAEVQLPDDQAEIVLTNPHFRLAGSPRASESAATEASPAATKPAAPVAAAPAAAKAAEPPSAPSSAS